MGLQSNNQDACRMSEQGSLEEQGACVRISCTHEQRAGSPPLSAQTHDSCHWSRAIYNARRELHPGASIFLLQKAKGEVTRQTGTSSKAQSAVGDVSVP